MNKTHFIEPTDVLFLRGNKLFGESGSYGESQMPPWPSVAAGALRSALMSRANINFKAFAAGAEEHPAIGSRDKPGDFCVENFSLARRDCDGQVETLHSIPADLVISTNSDDDRHAQRLKPWRPQVSSGLISSAATDQMAVLAQPNRGKPEGGLWLTQTGWCMHLQGNAIDPIEHLLSQDQLWKVQSRTGIGLNGDRRSVETGSLFTVQALAPARIEHSAAAKWQVGFAVTVDGMELPPQLSLRFGGDGQAAQSMVADIPVIEPDYARIAEQGRCRMILTSPGIFPGGWLPTGMVRNGAGVYFNLAGVSGRLVSAAVMRGDVVSGWDLAKRLPKAALRVAPVGSVYWLEDLQGSTEDLRKLVKYGLWPVGVENTQRRAEGFNRFTFANY